MRFSKPLKLNYVFRRLYTKGAVCASRSVVLYARKNNLGINRIGITTGKKLGHAVVRNRVRRRLREVYRINEARFIPGYDLVVVARTHAIEAKFTSLESDYLRCAKKLGLLQETQP